MSIDFTILCTRSPAEFLARGVKKKLSWNPAQLSGCFGSMDLRQDLRQPEDPLPDAGWAERVVAVIRAEGHLSDSLFDPFDEWIHALAEATHGAIYSPMAGKFLYIHPGVEREPTVARVQALLDARDYAGLARWITELGAAYAPKLRNPCPAWCQIGWIREASLKPLRGAVAKGDAGPASVIVALHRALSKGGCGDLKELQALARAAAKLPSLASDSDLHDMVAQRKKS